jgi:hypothetical protein
MPPIDRLRRRGFLVDEDLQRDIRGQEPLHRTEEAEREPLHDRYEERRALVVAEALPKAFSSEGRERSAMDFAKASRLEQAVQRSRVKVGQVRRRKTALPQAVQGAVETNAAEEARESEEGALAAGKDQHEEPSGRQPLEARRGRLSWRRKMLEDVVKRDDVEYRILGQVFRKEPDITECPSRLASAAMVASGSRPVVR